MISFPPSSAEGPDKFEVGCSGLSWRTPTEAEEAFAAEVDPDAGEGGAPELDVGVAGPPWE